MKFKLMDGKELTEFILGKPMNETYSFATQFPEGIDKNSIVNINESEFTKDLAMWYGIKKMNLFSANTLFVSVGYHGGGETVVYNIERIESMKDILENELQEYIDGVSKKGKVCVQLLPEESNKCPLCGQIIH